MTEQANYKAWVLSHTDAALTCGPLDAWQARSAIAHKREAELLERIAELERTTHSDLPVDGSVVLDKEICEWAQKRGMRFFYSGSNWHIKRGETWCTVGHETPQRALEACWESGEYDAVIDAAMKEAP